MSKKIIEKTIIIDATPDKVWRVFTDAKVTKQMGGKYLTDWKIGGAFGWQGNDNEVYSHGKILQLVKEKLLQHSIFDPDDRKITASVITYRLTEKEGKTYLHGREEMQEMPETEEDYAEAVEGWNIALNSVKELAEKLK